MQPLQVSVNVQVRGSQKHNWHHPLRLCCGEVHYLAYICKQTLALTFSSQPLEESRPHHKLHQLQMSPTLLGVPTHAFLSKPYNIWYCWQGHSLVLI